LPLDLLLSFVRDINYRELLPSILYINEGRIKMGKPVAEKLSGAE
jgi:hypothetical protein